MCCTKKNIGFDEQSIQNNDRAYEEKASKELVKINESDRVELHQAVPRGKVLGLLLFNNL